MSELPVPAIGIDLGTTNSCVAIYLNGRVEVLANEVGERTTPSYVAFEENEILVGKIAKEQSYRNIKNTIFDVKRLMGRKYHDPKVQKGIKYWPFVVTDHNGIPDLKIKLHDKKVSHSPEQISAEILKKLKDVASCRLESPVTKAVITVPAHFNDSQRQATKDAGKLAGLEVLMLLNEPTAAAITYAVDKTTVDCKHALVFDLGGGTFDVSIIKFENRRMTVKAINGNSHLGGNDIDKQLLTYFLDDIQERFDYNIQDDLIAMARLLSECERKKQMLSFYRTVELELFGLIEGKDYNIKLTREKFENLNEALFQKTLRIVKKCVKTASLTPADIDNVVLVGGSTKIPRIQCLLQEFFDGKVLSKSVNPDEAVAIGAAIQAANLSNNPSQVVEDFIIEDVVSFSLGLEVEGGLMTSLIKQNTLVPVTATKSFTTTSDNQTIVEIKIFEGQKKYTCENHLLGTFELTGIPPAPKGDPDIEVTFDIDVNGILHVTAVEKSANKKNNNTIIINRSRFNKNELDMMINRAEQHRTADEYQMAEIYERVELLEYDWKTKLSQIL